MMDIVLVGGGNQAHYIIDIIHKEGKYNIIGIIDSIHDVGSSIFGYKIIGRQENLKSLIDEYGIQGGIISIGDNWVRYNVSQQILQLIPDFTFINAIHPSTIIGENVTLGRGIVAMAGTIFNPQAVLGDFTFFATGAQIEHDCIIEPYASISAGSVLGGHVLVKRFAALTLNVTVVDRVTIGENTVVGSSSLVTKSIGDNILVYGNPAKFIRTRNKNEKFLK
jgi:sugar O-acyltransferase (sialic acid O-acetyltransferase NeuD family)|tara:strand:+ start:698 stop:1363 length:666 start_codon:yes stop_codon:yes gene_type:complete